MAARSARPFRSSEARIPSKRSVWSQISIAIGAAAAILVGANFTRPFYVSQAPLG